MSKLNRVPKVLLVDDIVFFQKMGELYLKNIGCDVTIVENGKDAVLEVVNNNYDVIFMDLQMPEMDGMDATINIRKINKDVLIIGLTAIDCVVDHTDCMDNGMDEVMVKPIKQKEMIYLLKKYGIIEKKRRIRKIRFKKRLDYQIDDSYYGDFKIINAPQLDEDINDQNDHE